MGVIHGETIGNVTNPGGMVDGQEPTVLTRVRVEEAPPTVVVDFGLNIVGILKIDFVGYRGLSEGLPGLRLAFSETMEHLTHRSDFTRSDNAAANRKLTRGTDQIAVGSEPYTWRDANGCWNGGQVCADGLHGFRYLKIWLDALESDAPHTLPLGSVSIASLSVEWSAYLGTADTFTGFFECSDQALTQWWFDGVYTVDLGTDVFLANETEPRGASSPTLDGKQVLLDGAKRDRDPYVGDLAVASLTSYLSHDFSASTRNVLEDLAVHQEADGWIPPASINNYSLRLFDYPLWWVVCAVDMVMYTGNTTFADRYWTVLAKTLDEYYPRHMDNRTGLLVKPAELGYGDYAFLPRSGPVTYYNALYVHALSYAAKLAEALGHGAAARRWSSRAAQVGAALMEHNFDARVGALYDGGPCPGAPAGTICNVHAQDGNALAVLVGIANQTVAGRILEYWSWKAWQPYGNAFYDSSVLSPKERFSERVYAFVSYFELAARLSTPGFAASAFDELRRLYGWMASHDPTVTMWEGIGPGGTAYQGGFTSMAHGWSTGVVPLMSNYVLGVTPLKPGFQEWQVSPVVQGGGLTWARGVVPTPGGGIAVSWEKGGTQAGARFSLNITAPRGTTGKVCLPDMGLATSRVKVDGKDLSMADLRGRPTNDSGVIFSLGGGEHQITVGH